MFTINDDNSIYLTRGDVAAFSVTCEDDGKSYVFQPGDVVRIKVFGKKDAENVVLQKDFPVVTATEEVEVFLSEDDTKIGDVISKPKDYWYEVELNPETNPKTIIGYDEDGAKVFKLFPEGDDIPPHKPVKPADIPVVDKELDLTSLRPVANQAVARAVARLDAAVKDNKTATDGIEDALSLERARLDNLISHKVTTVSQSLAYLEFITENTKAKLDAEINSDGVFASIKVNIREANLLLGGTEMDVFIIPSECRPVDVGLIHTEDGMEYHIKYDTENGRYVMTFKAQADVTYAPSGAGTVTMSYLLGDYELRDVRVGVGGTEYGTAGNAVRGQIKAVMDQVSIVQDSIFHKSALNLPCECYGSVKVTAENGAKVISGTNNVVALMELAQGAYTCKGVTVQVSGNTVTVSGTAEANVYFSLHTGVGESDVFHLLEGEAKLPERLYTLSQKVTSGTVFPMFAIRGKTGGNVATTQNNTSQFEYTEMQCGHPYLYITSGKTYDCVFVLGLFPYETTNAHTHREQTSVVEVFNTSGVYNATGYTWATGTATAEALTNKLPKKCSCRYEKRTVAYTGADEVLDVYIPAKVGYTHVLIGHSVSANGNADVWRIIQFAAVDDEMVTRYKITQFGETEMAVKINGRDDFIGGYTHGDEITVPGSAVFILDGEKVDPAMLTELTVFDELRISEATNMFDPADHTTQVGTHGKEYVITENGIYIDQSVKWMGAYTLDASYMPMLCAIRGNDKVSELQITDTYIDNGDFTPYDVGTAGFTTYPLTKKTGVDRVTLFSDKSGLCATVKVLESPDLPGAISFLYNGADTYNKIYFAVCGYGKTHTTTNGEKWRVRANIQIEIGNGIDA